MQKTKRKLRFTAGKIFSKANRMGGETRSGCHLTT